MIYIFVSQVEIRLFLPDANSGREGLALFPIVPERVSSGV
jgi:hypothetical protein